MSKSAEQIKEELRTLRTHERREEIDVAQHNGQRSTPAPRQRIRMKAPYRNARSRLFLPFGCTELPHSAETEKALLCCMMKSRPVIIELSRKITPAHFYVPAHQKIFQAILDHFEQVEVIDFSTVTQYLIGAGQLDQVGGPGYVTDIGTFGAIPENLAYYFEDVEEKYVLRQAIVDASEAIWRASEPQADVSLLVEYVQARAAGLGNLASPSRSSLSVRTISELIAMRFDESDNYFGDRILAAGQPCTLLGPGGVGKSRYSSQLAVCMITGHDFLDMKTRAKGMKWLFMQTENSNRRLQYDLKNIVSALSLTVDELAEVERCLFIHTLENDADCFLNLLNPDNCAAVSRLIQDVEPDFVVWDPLNSLTNNDLNSDMDMRAVVLAIATVTRMGNANRVPLVIHHSLTGRTGAARSVGWDKSSYGRNSKVLQAWSRAQINLAPRSGDDTNLLVMSCGKNNNGRLFPEIGLQFDEDLGIYVKDRSFDPEEFREEIGLDQSKKKKAVEPHEIADLVEDGIPRSKLVEAIEIKFSVAKKTAYRAIEKAESTGLIRKERGRNWNASYFKCDLKAITPGQ